MDLNELKQKLANLNKRTTKSKDIWKPKDEHQVRLVTYKHGDEPLVPLSFHNEIGDNMPILCPKENFGKECPFCDFADALKSFNYADGRKKSDSDKKKDWELFKKIQAKARIYVAMVERGHENEGPQFWGMTQAQATQVLEICSDGDRLEELGIDKDDTSNALRVLFDTDKGYDLTISYAKPGEKGNAKTFTTITIKGKIKPTPLSKDKNEVKRILDSVKKIDEVFPEVPVSEVKKLFERWVNSAGEEAKPEGGTQKYGGEEKQESKPANTKENAKVSGTRSIDEAFGDMLKD